MVIGMKENKTDRKFFKIKTKSVKTILKMMDGENK